MTTQKTLMPNRPYKFYQSLPKVELHRHLEGSLRLETMFEVVSQRGMPIRDIHHLRSLVQVKREAVQFKISYQV
jgi:adenosine deaminase